MQIYQPNSYTTEKQNHLLIFVTNYKWNGLKMALNLKNINNFTQWEKWISRLWRSCARSRTKSTSRSLGAVRGVQWTFSIHSAYLLKSQSDNKKLSWSVWTNIYVTPSTPGFLSLTHLTHWANITNNRWLRKNKMKISLHWTTINAVSSTLNPHLQSPFWGFSVLKILI